MPTGASMTRLLLAGALLGALVLAPRVAAACSLASPWESSTRRPGRVEFLGAPTPDTVLAGAGAMPSGSGPGHLGPTRAGRAIHGQVVRVRRLSAAADPALAAAVKRAGGRVVLVPWDYGPDCSPLPWGRSARWLPDPVGGLFTAVPRDPAHWADGMPTFDLTPVFVPYTGAPAPEPGARSGGEWLAPDELFELLATLPTSDAVEERLDEAYAPLRAWIAAHPGAADREPVREVVRHMAYSLSHLRMRRREVALVGTWRVTVVMPTADGGAADSVTFHVRTADRPTGTAGGRGASRGVYVHACAHAAEAALAGMREFGGCRGGGAVGAEGYVAVGDSVWTDAEGRRARAGSFDLIAGDEALRRRYDRLSRQRIQSTAEDDPRRFLPGTFTEWPDGRVVFTLDAGSSGAPVPRVTAERVSTATMPRAPGGR